DFLLLGRRADGALPVDRRRSGGGCGSRGEDPRALRAGAVSPGRAGISRRRLPEGIADFADMKLFPFLLALWSALAQAYPFLTGYDEAPSVAAALDRVKAGPNRHALLYFDMSQYCPPCTEVRAILNSDAVRAKWKPNYV